MNDFLAFSGMDWITPVWGYIRRIFSGPEYTFLFPISTWSGKEIIRLLRKHKIQTWGEMVVSDTIMISVPLAKASLAQYLFDRNGIFVENPYPKKGKKNVR